MRSDRRESGFTLLEIMVTLAVISVSIFGLIDLRERSISAYIEARNLNLARMLAREILTELEFHEVESRGGQVDQYPGFSYMLDIEEVDLVTGEGDPEAEKREQEKKAKRSGDYDPDTRFQPSDLVKPDEELQALVFPVRKVKLTLRYPNVREDAKEPFELIVETILPPLPEYIEEHNKKMESPFQSDKN